MKQKGIDRFKVIEIAAGEDHSLALTEAGEVFSWGHGLYGQLGQGDVKDLWFP
jgi:alpha-tubulin suppressor-like RCC1 family protein